MRAIRRALDRQHIEAPHILAPTRFALQKELGGPNYLALLAPCDRTECAAEITPPPLPDFDDGQHAVIETYQIQLSGPAAQVPRDNRQASRLEVIHRELLGGAASLNS